MTNDLHEASYNVRLVRDVVGVNWKVYKNRGAETKSLLQHGHSFISRIKANAFHGL